MHLGSHYSEQEQNFKEGSEVSVFLLTKQLLPWRILVCFIQELVSAKAPLYHDSAQSMLPVRATPDKTIKIRHRAKRSIDYSIYLDSSKT